MSGSSTAPRSQQTRASTARLSGRRHELMVAAVGVVAAEGLRGLTHRAVDRAGGLPQGTCSAYFRTRQALVAAVAEHVAGSLADDLDSLADHLPSDPEGVVAGVTTMFSAWLAERDLLLTRVELTLEASRNPPVAGLLSGWRRRMITVVDGLLAARGKQHDPVTTETVAAAVEGVLLAALAKPPAERDPFLTESLARLLTALVGPPGPNG